MNKRQLIAGALSTSLLVAALPGMALAQDDPAESVTPEGAEWQLASLAGASVADGVEVSLLLDGGEVVGNAGCNSYFGSYVLEGESLTFPEPFGVTAMLCEGPAQETEDAYLPLLQATAGWTVDEEGLLNLSDAEGAVQLVYSETPIDITASDLGALAAALADLQAQIDDATTEVKALAKEAKSINAKKFDKRLKATEGGVAQLDEKVGKTNPTKMNTRLKAVEQAVADNKAAIASLDKAVTKVKNRVKAAEKTIADHETRIAALEEAAPKPEQPLP